MKNAKEKQIKKLRDGIRRHSPIVADYFERHDRIVDYARTIHGVILDDVQRARQHELSRYLGQIQKRIFGHPATIAPPLAVNIVDHHAWLNHPIMVATNVVANAHRMLSETPQQPIVVFTSSIVPPNNFFNRKGFLLHGKKIPLFSNQSMHQASCFIPRREFCFTHRLRAIGSWNSFTPEEQKFLSQLEREVNVLNFSAAENYNDQISIIDRWLWQQLFQPDLRAAVPDLEYITQEEVFQKTLPLVFGEDTFLCRVLFDPMVRDDILQSFRGITGCWDEAKAKGTHFFWYREKNNQPGRLYCRDEKLVSEDQTFSIPLRPEAIVKAIEDRCLVPDLFLIFGFVIFWCGVQPLAGYGSGNYLTRMKAAWQEVLRRHAPDEAVRVSRINTQSLIGGLTVTFNRDPDGTIAPSSAADVIFAGGLSRAYLERLLAMRFCDLLGPALPEIYQSYVPAGEREDLGIASADFMGSAFDWLR